MLRIIAAVLVGVLVAAPAAAQDVTWSFDKRLSDVEARLGAVEKALGLKVAADPVPEATAVAPAPATKVVAITDGSTVAVYHQTHAIGGDGGSGVVVWSDGKKSIVATCKHVVPDQGLGVFVTTRDGRKLAARLLAAVGNYDLSLLEVSEGLPASKPLEKGPGDNTPVIHFGKTTGHAVGVTTGWVSLGGSYYVEADYESDSGDSGAGVFDQQGRLVGIHCGGQQKAPGVVRKHLVPPSVVLEMTQRAVAGEFARPTVSASPQVGDCPGGVCYPAGYTPTYRLSPLGSSYCPTGNCPNVR